MRRGLLLMSVVPAAALLAAASATVTQAAAGSPSHRADVQVSADPFTNAAAEHATEVEPDTVTAGHRVMSVFQVGRWGSGCADDTGWAFSPDGGRSWRHGDLPGLTRSSRPAGSFDRVSDPTVAYNARFREWIAAGLDCDGTSATALPRTPSVSVNISRDGIHWTKTIIVARATAGQEYDKDWVTCDNTPSSRFYGNCYTEWDIDTNGDTVVMSTSRDGGQHWSAPATTASRLEGIGGEPVVLPDGTVVVPIDELSGAFGVVDFRSTDGGRTWGRTIRVASLTQHVSAGALRGPFFPGVGLDASGRIYLAWPDCRFRPRCASNDMVMTTSASGLRWTPVVRIPIDPVSSTVDHLGGGLGVDRTTSGRHARLGLFYYFYPHSACTTTTCRIYEGFVSSTDGGGRWSAPKVLAGPFRLGQLASAAGFMTGDYQGAAVVPGGDAVSAFAVGGVPAGRERLSEAMFEPSGGARITGGSRPASAAGARAYGPAKIPAIVW
jgi:BNR repeat-like domain